MARGLLVHAGALGDYVMTLRVVASMRAAGVNQLTVIGHSEVACVGRLGGGVDEIRDLETGRLHRLFAANAEEGDATLRQSLRGFDLTVNMMAGGTAGLCGVRLASLTGGRVVDLDPRPRLDLHGHITEQWLRDLSAAGLPANVGPPSIVIEDEMRRRARRALATLGDALSEPPTATRSDSPAPGAAPDVPAPARLALLHPGSGGRRKCWPLESYLELSDHLRRAGWITRAMLGPVELETWPADNLAKLRTAMQVVESSSLIEVAAMLAAADLFVGNDSGVSHLAAAVGTDTVAVFGSTAPERWRPLGPQVRVAGGPGSEGGWPGVRDVGRVCTELTDTCGGRRPTNT